MQRYYYLMIFPVLLLIGACHRWPVEPLPYSGLYKATTFILPGPADGEYDVLARGGFLELRLHDDGTTSGRQYVPYEPGSAHDISLAGTYTIVGDEIHFDMVEENTWFELRPMVLGNGEIRTNNVMSYIPHHVVLTKVE